MYETIAIDLELARRLDVNRHHVARLESRGACLLSLPVVVKGMAMYPERTAGGEPRRRHGRRVASRRELNVLGLRSGDTDLEALVTAARVPDEGGNHSGDVQSDTLKGASRPSAAYRLTTTSKVATPSMKTRGSAPMTQPPWPRTRRATCPSSISTELVRALSSGERRNGRYAYARPTRFLEVA